jgi:hypothetical protein
MDDDAAGNRPTEIELEVSYSPLANSAACDIPKYNDNGTLLQDLWTC